jgi:FkbM family methyltransferase
MEGRHVSARLHFRPGTMDRAIYDAVVTRNEYRLPRRFEPADAVVDVGGHIGSFSHAALLRGAGQVWAFEAEPGNYAVLRDNLSPYGTRAVVRHAAVARSDQNLSHLWYRYPPDRTHTGGGGVCCWPTEQTVPAVPFDAVLDEVTRGGRVRVRLLKLDCEGSEWPILLTSRRLGLVDAVCGEYHLAAYRGPLRVDGYDRYSPDVLQGFLTSQGFDTEVGPAQLSVGLFFARRPGVAAFAPVWRPGVVARGVRKSRRLLGALRRLWPFGAAPQGGR